MESTSLIKLFEEIDKAFYDIEEFFNNWIIINNNV
jgi:hypothetical protein